tara:strand:+ start:163 stop:588 length:426 start_codon:yes stop_codon:yes gene_type:complete
MPHEPTAMGHPVGEGQLLLDDSVGVVKYFNTREQVCGAAPVPFTVVPILKFIVQGQWNAVGHSFGLGCLDGAVFFGTTGGEQGGTGNSGFDKAVYRKSGLHALKKRLSWFKTSNTIPTGFMESNTAPNYLQRTHFFQHYDD